MPVVFRTLRKNLLFLFSAVPNPAMISGSSIKLNRPPKNGLRGVQLRAVGSAPRARLWLHLPHLKRLAAYLEATPEDWDPLTEYFESYQHPNIAPSELALEIPEL
ncbi:hypothetical protein FRC12_002596 [Ceratobasidium sp. 428]|nr:hypothetical protein FRC09_017603 [Ceratobasidium sp. 395]KAG8796217.1 hypothetical protein FRC12_002596 [Ceratobasidium sp. 428]